eukprot:c5739_g1_i2.p1 GENE.c5739_g1_i2~~c5739_g1_i2.p1  ORF type:complete len:400 (-),score=30.18 c5739_g1_i2:182-1381(-)
MVGKLCISDADCQGENICTFVTQVNTTLCLCSNPTFLSATIDGLCRERSSTATVGSLFILLSTINFISSMYALRHVVVGYTNRVLTWDTLTLSLTTIIVANIASAIARIYGLMMVCNISTSYKEVSNRITYSEAVSVAGLLFAISGFAGTTLTTMMKTVELLSRQDWSTSIRFVTFFEPIFAAVLTITVFVLIYGYDLTWCGAVIGTTSITISWFVFSLSSRQMRCEILKYTDEGIVSRSSLETIRRMSQSILVILLMQTPISTMSSMTLRVPDPSPQPIKKAALVNFCLWMTLETAVMAIFTYSLVRLWLLRNRNALGLYYHEGGPIKRLKGQSLDLILVRQDSANEFFFDDQDSAIPITQLQHDLRSCWNGLKRLAMRVFGYHNKIVFRCRERLRLK